MFYPNPAIDNPACVNTFVPVKKSRFDGKLKGLIGIYFLLYFIGAFLGVITGVYIVLALDSVLASFTDSSLYYAVFVVGFIPVLFFLAFAVAWSIIIYQRWEAKHTVISGHPVYFNAKVFPFAWTVFKWILFGLFTFYIYWLWQPIRFRKWKWAHTIVDPYAQVVDVQNVCQNGPMKKKK